MEIYVDALAEIVPRQIDRRLEPLMQVDGLTFGLVETREAPEVAHDRVDALARVEDHALVGAQCPDKSRRSAGRACSGTPSIPSSPSPCAMPSGVDWPKALCIGR